MGLFLFVCLFFFCFILYFSFRVFSKSSVWIELDSRPKLGQGCHNSWSPPYQILSVADGMGLDGCAHLNGSEWDQCNKNIASFLLLKIIHCLIFVKKKTKIKTLYTVCDTTHIKREKRQLCAFSFLFSYLLKQKNKKNVVVKTC